MYRPYIVCHMVTSIDGKVTGEFLNRPECEAALMEALEELEATARLRIKYRDLSLSQLAAVAVPAISKSGLSHRLKKIMEYSETLLPSVKK